MKNAVLLEIEKNIAVITLNRPERYNAVNQDLVDGINDCLSIVENNENIRAIVKSIFLLKSQKMNNGFTLMLKNQQKSHHIKPQQHMDL